MFMMKFYMEKKGEKIKMDSFLSYLDFFGRKKIIDCSFVKYYLECKTIP